MECVYYIRPRLELPIERVPRTRNFVECSIRILYTWHLLAGYPCLAYTALHCIDINLVQYAGKTQKRICATNTYASVSLAYRKREYCVLFEYIIFSFAVFYLSFIFQCIQFQNALNCFQILKYCYKKYKYTKYYCVQVLFMLNET